MLTFWLSNQLDNKESFVTFQSNYQNPIEPFIFLIALTRKRVVHFGSKKSFSKSSKSPCRNMEDFESPPYGGKNLTSFEVASTVTASNSVVDRMISDRGGRKRSHVQIQAPANGMSTASAERRRSNLASIANVASLFIPSQSAAMNTQPQTVEMQLAVLQQQMARVLHLLESQNSGGGTNVQSGVS